METKSFFGEQGLTSTSANFYANLAKEQARKIQQYLQNVRFYSTDIRIIGDDKNSTISKGLTPESFPVISDGLKLLSDTNSLIAFLREAIKEKERLGEEAENWVDDERRKAHAERVMEHNCSRPVIAPSITTDDVIKTWSVGEQEKYLSLEAEAAVYGKLVHQDGALSKARQDMYDKINNPMSLVEGGRDTVIYSYQPTTDPKSLDNLFFSLQQHHREVQAELNGMKKKIEDTVHAHNLRVQMDYNEALNHYHAEDRAISQELEEIEKYENVIREQKSMKVKNLKIVIPNRLKSVFESLKNL